jgi:hypothetical protein
VWDFTCSHTLAASVITRAALGQGIVATDAETREAAKYSYVSSNYIFVPIAIETFGAVGLDAFAFSLISDVVCTLPLMNHVSTRF